MRRSSRSIFLILFFFLLVFYSLFTWKLIFLCVVFYFFHEIIDFFLFTWEFHYLLLWDLVFSLLEFFFCLGDYFSSYFKVLLDGWVLFFIALIVNDKSNTFILGMGYHNDLLFFYPCWITVQIYIFNWFVYRVSLYFKYFWCSCVSNWYDDGQSS